MDKKDLSALHSWFDTYIKNFNTGDARIDTNIIHKKEHTLRVCNNIVEIGKSLNLSNEELYLAETIALFHDIGRFEQFKKYKTFKDSISEDHADMGLRVLHNSNILNDLTEKEREIILTAIQYHNKFAVPENLSSEYLFYCNLIRDADKVDILELIVHYYENPEIYENAAFEDFPNSSEYQVDFIEDIINGKKISYNNIKTTADMKLLRVAWVYDIHFNQALRMIKEQQYIERIIKLLPNTNDIKKLYQYIDSYMHDKLHAVQ